MNVDPFLLSQYTEQSLSRTHHVLRSSRRRLTIMFLTRKVITGLTNDQEAVHPMTHVVQEEVPVRKLARQITSVEEDIPIEEATGEPYRNVYTSLIQSHLERLEEAGAVKYDTNAKTVVPGQNLLALATVAMTTSSITRLLFSHDVAELQTNNPSQELRD